MYNNLDLWGDIRCDDENTLEILTLLENQADLLSSKTNGIVKVDFSKLKYQFAKKQIDTRSALVDIAKSSFSLMSPLVGTSEGQEVNEHKDLENASVLYEQCKYKFELYSSKYKFRMFTMYFKSVFPIKLEIEYGILSDNTLTQEINSFDEMTATLGSIFRSHKVRFIIQRMIELDKQ